jgi:hypothetical protein
MAWLKQAFFTVTVTDVMCDVLEGKMWSEASFAELLAIPRDDDPEPQPGDVKRKSDIILSILD